MSPAALARVMEADPYFVTQDNGAGAPLHFAVTYKQLDMVREREGRGGGGDVFFSCGSYRRGGRAPTFFSLFPQVHHLLNLGAEINQPDPRGWTPLHRAAHLAHYDG